LAHTGFDEIADGPPETLPSGREQSTATLHSDTVCGNESEPVAGKLRLLARRIVKGSIIRIGGTGFVSTGGNVQASQITRATLELLRFRSVGPHRGGRVVAVAGDVSDYRTFYFGACAGGVWKTTDGGQHWRNISDGFINTAAIGALAVSEADPNVIYAGTGETSIRNNVSHGDGVYRSTDGGRTWQNVGLSDTRHIGKIQIHPHDPYTVYVAALGHAWGQNEERGVFRSYDGGETWEKVLYKSARAGSHDVSMDPNNPRTLYAAIWQAQRYPHALVSGGEECGIWRSFDSGDTWEDISRRPGLPKGLLGKIGVVASPAKPGRVWALVEAEDGAVFRSDDYGETWTRLSEQSLLRTRPWYYMHITADPQDPDTVWVQNYSLWKSIDGGATFERVPTPHGDDHALWIDPNDPQRMIEGNDGGACVTFNGGRSWSSIYNQPTAQFYHVITDDRVPYRIYGSQQDNSALTLPSASVEGAIHERDWYAPGGGESGYIAIKHDDQDIVVASGPQGRHAYNDIMSMYNHRTGQVWNITVWPELYGWGVGSIDLKYRFQWTFPILFSRHNPDELYVASNHVHRSSDLGASFDVVSPDLTRDDPDKLQASGGPITRDNTGAEVYCTIFALMESLHEPGVFWAGSDDGLMHITRDNCQSWQPITPPDLPEWSQISIIDPSPHDPATAYVAAMRYKHDDNRPFLYKTNDYGETWTLITNGIPEHEFTRVIREDPNRRGLLYAGTETGIYASFDDGGHWHRLTGNLPVVPIYDLVIKGNEMIVATHGRSFWVLDDVTPLHQIQDGIAESAAHLFKPKPTMRLRTYGRFRGEPIPEHVSFGRVSTSVVTYETVREADGTLQPRFLDAGENPPNGVIIHYYLAEAPADGVTLAILDSDGNELRKLTTEADAVPARASFNRHVWNMRLPGAVNVKNSDLQTWDRPDGPWVLPGEYQVEIEVGDHSQHQRFTIEPDPRIETTMDELREQFDMLIEIRDKLTAVNMLVDQTSDLIAQAEAWRERATISEDGREIADTASELASELHDIRGKLIDVNMRQSQLWPSGLHEKLNALFESVDSADYAPPRQAREVFEKLSAELDELSDRFQRANEELAGSLSQQIQQAGWPVVGVRR
jgi:photosystem II stability/assembly factor-like uncharacterized protein